MHGYKPVSFIIKIFFAFTINEIKYKAVTGKMSMPQIKVIPDY